MHLCLNPRLLAISGLFVLGLTPPAQATLTLDFSYIDTQSPAFLRFESWADNALPPTNQIPYGMDATDAVVLYVKTNDPAWANLAVALVEDQVADAEAAWSAVPAQRPSIAGDSYLHSGPMMRELAMTYAYCSAFVSTGQRNRWAAYAEQTLFNIWNHTSASWGGHAFPWTGWSVDNPGNNYYYSFVEATMFWGFAKPVGGTDWIAYLETQKIPPLTAYFQQLTGGGSREGTGYGLAHGRLFDLYRVWFDSRPDHQNIADDSSHLLDSIDYWIHATLPTFDRYAPVGDLSRESYPSLYDYHRALVLKARRMAGATPQAHRATWWLNRISVDEMQSGFNLRDDLLPEGTIEEAPPALHHHALGTGHLFARSDWTANATWMSFFAGVYEESHAHQDQGAFTLFQGDFLAVTENIFSHSGIQQGTEVHNVLRFVQTGTTIGQRHGVTTMNVTPLSGGRLQVGADLTPFYDPAGPVDAWQRNLTFGPGALEVHDVYTVASGSEAIFQVNVPVQPTIEGAIIRAGNLVIRPLVPAHPIIDLFEWHPLDPDEFNSGWKVELRGATGEWRVRLETTGALFADGFESGDTSAWSP